MRLAAAGSNRLNCFFLFLCSTLRAKPEPIIPPGSVQNATPTIHKVVATILPAKKNDDPYVHTAQKLKSVLSDHLAENDPCLSLSVYVEKSEHLKKLHC
ncbi:hypothetical protein BpHYR1_023833 [Brachionus plicatilis]|uniref:Uncharacterized protein n=1 Tax=Brachionus plicatilis TaxID=10195 RepID=A0A3M7PR98_BRAPC|nr:hypothetical protein BpHYR1_023833 [Brachionus plicatilis]